MNSMVVIFHSYVAVSQRVIDCLWGFAATCFTGDYDGPQKNGLGHRFQPSSTMRWDRGIFNGSYHDI